MNDLTKSKHVNISDLFDFLRTFLAAYISNPSAYSIAKVQHQCDHVLLQLRQCHRTLVQEMKGLKVELARVREALDLANLQYTSALYEKHTLAQERLALQQYPATYELIDLIPEEEYDAKVETAVWLGCHAKTDRAMEMASSRDSDDSPLSNAIEMETGEISSKSPPVMEAENGPASQVTASAPPAPLQKMKARLIDELNDRIKLMECIRELEKKKSLILEATLKEKQEWSTFRQNFKGLCQSCQIFYPFLGMSRQGSDAKNPTD